MTMPNHHPLGRRNFLRGLGACLAIPAMDSLLPRSARAEEAAAPKRLLYWYVPNGFNMAEFVPAEEGEGNGWQLSSTLEPLEAYKDDILVVSGTDNLPGAMRDGDLGAGAHYQQTAAFLTCTHVRNASSAVGKSIDQVCADAIGFATPHRSLQLGLALGGSGLCGQWNCAYASFISWAAHNTPIAQLTNPRTTFETLFGPGATGVSQDDFDKRKAYRLGILDVVNEDATALKRKLGQSDKLKLERYLTAVRETEARVENLEYGLSCDPGMPPEDAAVYIERLDQMVDIIALAFECDITRIISFMTYTGGASHNIDYDWVPGVDDNLHNISHHGNVAEQLVKLAAINRWEVEVFARLVGKLKVLPDVNDSSILDNSLLFFSSEIADGNLHAVNDMPVVIAGSGQGAIETNRHVRYAAPNNTFADLHIAVANAFDVPVTSFGEDGTGPLPGILA
jgi:hypothetical protein